MKSKYRIARYFLVAFVLCMGVFAAQAIAQQKSSAGGAPCSSAGGAPCEKSVNTNTQNTGFKLNIKLNNPLGVESVQDAVKLFVNAIVRLAIPVIVIFFLWSGLMFIFAQGKPDKIKEAKNMFFFTIIGTLLILGAWTITNAIIGTVNSITN